MYLVTGAAGFIGYHTCEALLAAGEEVLGVDNLNRYYPVALKQARLERLQRHAGFSFQIVDIANHDALVKSCRPNDVDVVIHLAAQAGVRHSLSKPFDYAAANLTGHLSVLEFCRHAAREPLLVYASSSSVYGGNTKVPFSETDPVDTPVSLYAATKRADELMSSAYASLYGLRQIGLRFFTVYGPWGRPDMAYWSFADAILKGEPIRVFNNGDLKRDFTYIDDITKGVVATATQAPALDPERPHKVYNIGNHEPVGLLRFIELLEERLGKTAEKIMEPMQPGDVYETYADIDAIRADYGFEPTTSLEDGLTKFVDWFKAYRADPETAAG
ncbi:MAG: NAD-dependent epimerase/dehydratase family protein [Maricaulaceae bacterium]|jgi:UDP-glucuronate 4-epimerase